MQILMVASENAVIDGAKVGGVADVIRDVPPALASLGNQVSVVIPSHNGYQNNVPSSLVSEVTVWFRGKQTQMQLFQLHLKDTNEGVHQFVLYHPSFDADGGGVYLFNDPDGPFAADANKFALFCSGVAQCLKDGILETPDVIHLHDWHAAMLGVLLANHPDFKQLAQVKRVFTIHNLAIQGIRPIKGTYSSFQAWFPDLAFEQGLFADPRYLDCFNPMRAGITLSDKVHVVSPTYALEVLKASNIELGFIGGEGLENDLSAKHEEGNLIGILNGCPYEADDTVIYQLHEFLTTAKIKSLSWAAKHKHVPSDLYVANERIASWLSEQWQSGPLVTSVGRLTAQKVSLLVEVYQGQPTLSHILSQLTEVNGRMILIGCGDDTLAKQFTLLMAEHENFLFINAYDHLLSASLYSLGDLFLMPSSYEPCGISQLLAMRAGQPCLVNAVGGLADTVSNRETGFVFEGDNIQQKVENLLQVFSEAIRLFAENPEQYSEICQRASKQRFSWQSSVEDYMGVLYHA